MKALLKIISAFTLLILGIYLDDNVRGTGLALGILVFVIGWVIEELLNKYRGYDCCFFRWVGVAFSIIFFCCLGQGVHIEERNDGIVEVRSPFLKRVIESGQRLEKINLHTFYSRCYQSYNLESEDYYLIYHFQGDSSYVSIYNTLTKVLRLPDTCFTIEEIKGRYGGTIQYIKCHDKAYFLHGSFSNGRFNEYVLDITPECNL